MYSILATSGATTNMFSNIDFTAITDAAATIAPQVITPIVTVLSAFPISTPEPLISFVTCST